MAIERPPSLASHFPFLLVLVPFFSLILDDDHDDDYRHVSEKSTQIV
jgi:hypothetical protein